MTIKVMSACRQEIIFTDKSQTKEKPIQVWIGK